MIAAATFGLIAYLVGNLKFSGLPRAAQRAERRRGRGVLRRHRRVGPGLPVVQRAAGADLHGRQSGALSLGGALGAVAVATKHEIVLGIVGGLFVIETVSVIIQVLWFKRTGRRVFLMAPIHHHFERLGWSEPTVVIRFWIVAIMLAMLGLATLKLR